MPPKNNETSIIKSEDFFYPYFNGQINRYETIRSDYLYVDPNKLGESKSINFFNEIDILARQLVTRQFKLQFQISDQKFAFKKNLYGIKINNKENWNSHSLLAVLNSNKFSYLNVIGNVAVQRDDFPSFSLQEFKNFNIPIIEKSISKNLENLVLKILDFKQNQTAIIQNFIQLIKAKYTPKMLSTKLKTFYNLEFSEFIIELKKQKVVLGSLSAESELLQFFESEKKKILELKIQIEQVDAKIEEIVMMLYGLEGVILD